MDPLDVPLPEVYDNEPKFVSKKGWLEKVTTDIFKYFNAADSAHRVPPMAFVRCSRGGKTRALKEVAHSIRKQDKEIAILFVSFSDSTAVDEPEKKKPLEALCRRIAFLGQKEEYKWNFSRYNKTCSKELIEE